MNKRIYTTIKQRILDLSYEPGRNLNLKKLADELGVSQTPIREVLLRLEWEKLVAIFPRMGIRVTKIDFKELKDIYRSRILIEGELGRLAARNITDKQLQEMKNLLIFCKRIKGEQAREELVLLDTKFRTVLFQAANCQILQELSELLYNQTLRVWHLTFDEMNVVSEVNMEAEEIENTIEALSKRNQDIAQNLRRKVIVGWVDRLHNYYTRY
ncbi:MAG: GntR family transcriptional regulator [Deltaproteobacteria bacterium]|nr:GntR family transcriptional regulator [Deltaproteobacteria bacterium]